MSRHLKHARTSTAPKTESADVGDRVKAALDAIRSRGDEAVRELSELYDEWSPERFRLSESETAAAIASVPKNVLSEIEWAQDQVRAFAREQRASMLDIEVETLPGVRLGHRHTPIAAVGAYVPGGRYPLIASAAMTICTAKVAGVARVAACTPPMKGAVPAVTVAAMKLAGADEIYVLGGMQAIGALGIGTSEIARVDMLAGPGNAFVAEAKRQLFGEVGIDLVAGPTEVLIIADDSADPLTVAVDLLSQAEHGIDSPAVLVTTSPEVGQATCELIERLLPGMSTHEIASVAWRDHGEVILVEDLREACAVADTYASEHVQVLTQNPREVMAQMRNYGAIFLGENTCVSFGDKVIGTNHVLPTRGGARYTGGLWVGNFLKTQTHQVVDDVDSAMELGWRCARASRQENFDGHARSGEIRAAGKGPLPDWANEVMAQWADDRVLERSAGEQVPSDAGALPGPHRAP